MEDLIQIPDKSWRQGSVAGHEIVASARNPSQIPDLAPAANDLIIVLSQDCDIVHNSYEAEPYVEFIIARRKDQECLDQGLHWGKHPRRFQFERQDDVVPTLYEAKEHERFRLPRQMLVGAAPLGQLDTKLTEALARWVAKRYTRAAFPDEFNRRCNEGKKKIAALFKQSGHLILQIQVRVEPGDQELSAAEEYQISL